MARVQAEFESKRRTINPAPITKTPLTVVSELSDREAHDIVLRFFIGIEKEASEWCEDNRHCSEEERESLLENLRIDECIYAGTSKHYEPNDGAIDVATFLKHEEIACREDSPAFRKLRPLFRLARVENLERTIDRIEGRTVRAKDPLFQNAFAYTAAPTQQRFETLGRMLSRFEQWLADAGRSKSIWCSRLQGARSLRLR